MIDYGSDEVPTDTLRGIASHKPVHPLHAVGHADLSVDVDFGAMRLVASEEAGEAVRCPPLLPQRDFLAGMGLEARVNALLKTCESREAKLALVRSASRLVETGGMGSAYKVFAIASEKVGADGVAGFPDAPLLSEQRDAGAIGDSSGSGGGAESSDKAEEEADPAAGRKIRKVRL